MKPKKKKLCIYPKDVSTITGRSIRSSYDLLTRIRLLRQKQRHQAVSVNEFCEYIGLKPDDVLGELQR